MVVVRIDGGLGNQMFQYAMYRYLMTIVPKENVYIDLDCYNPHQSGNLTDYFSITPRQISLSEKKRFNRNGIWHLFRVTDRMGITDANYYREDMISDENIDDVVKKGRVYLRGYWQKAYYASVVDADLRRDFDFSGMLENAAPEVSEKNKKILEEIESSVSVAVHIRGGDYLAASESYGGICTADYYSRAVKEIEKRVENPRYFIFTNDTEYMNSFSEVWQGRDVHIAEANDEEHGHLDMLLMSRCRHHVLANSSFSYWGAWLGKNPDQIAILPKRWDSGRSSDELCNPGWIQI